MARGWLHRTIFPEIHKSMSSCGSLVPKSSSFCHLSFIRPSIVIQWSLDPHLSIKKSCWHSFPSRGASLYNLSTPVKFCPCSVPQGINVLWQSSSNSFFSWLMSSGDFFPRCPFSSFCVPKIVCLAMMELPVFLHTLEVSSILVGMATLNRLSLASRLHDYLYYTLYY